MHFLDRFLKEHKKSCKIRHQLIGYKPVCIKNITVLTSGKWCSPDMAIVSKCSQIRPPKATTKTVGFFFNNYWTKYIFVASDMGSGDRSLSIVFAFNKTDWSSIGWKNYLEGFTLYYR